MPASDLDQARQLGSLNDPAANSAEPGQKNPILLDAGHDLASVVVLDGGD